MNTSTAGRTASAPRVEKCPAWCVVEHGDDPIDDIFHRGSYAQVGVPDDQVYLSTDDLKMVAHLCLPEVPEPGDENGFVVLHHGDLWGPYAELDIEGTDQLIRDVKTFAARLQQLRDQMAAVKEQQS
ncbi:hypothetical protein AB0D14_01935 [Streptomyces sp. NPDC048484]|uniref:DUF6907 domain-containing protein n=1 Tax=Streptomyces sp. NPDC048484 TaxID=3155146 RepID=UPI00342C2628